MSTLVVLTLVSSYQQGLQWLTPHLLSSFIHRALLKLACDSRPGLQLTEIHLPLLAKCYSWMGAPLSGFFKYLCLVTSEIVFACILYSFAPWFSLFHETLCKEVIRKSHLQREWDRGKTHTITKYILFGGGSWFSMLYCSFDCLSVVGTCTLTNYVMF